MTMLISLDPGGSTETKESLIESYGENFVNHIGVELLRNIPKAVNPIFGLFTLGKPMVLKPSELSFSTIRAPFSHGSAISIKVDVLDKDFKYIDTVVEIIYKRNSYDEVFYALDHDYNSSAQIFANSDFYDPIGYHALLDFSINILTEKVVGDDDLQNIRKVLNGEEICVERPLNRLGNILDLTPETIENHGQDLKTLILRMSQEKIQFSWVKERIDFILNFTYRDTLELKFFDNRIIFFKFFFCE